MRSPDTARPGDLLTLTGVEVPRDRPSSFWELPYCERVRERVTAVVQAGIELDKFGQIVPCPTRANLQKIAENLFMIRERVAQQIQAGKHVIYTPGSYDLVHAGHASYIMECVAQYLKEHAGLTRKDVYVVVLSDNDELIGGVKPPHLAAIKGEHPRPIENDRLFRHYTEQLGNLPHPRLIDLASLPVDLVGFIPAPTQFHSVLGNGAFREWLALKSHVACPPEAEAKVAQAVQQYNKLLDHLRDGNMGAIVTAFEHAFCGLSSYDANRADWDVASWQLMVHQFIGDVYSSAATPPYTRMISVHDGYAPIVAQIMNLCRISHLFLDDVEVVSTTTLIDRFGWEPLVRSKMAAYERLLASR